MSTYIVKFDKDLTEIGRMELSIENPVELIVMQYGDCNTKSYSFAFPFEISVAKDHAPYVEEEMVVVIREKVDLTATGPNDVTIKNIGRDLGGDDSVLSTPYRPKDLPPGFQELIRL